MWQRCAAAMASTAPLGELARGREQSERVRMSEHSGFASLFSPCWPDQLGRCRRAAATTRSASRFKSAMAVADRVRPCAPCGGHTLVLAPRYHAKGAEGQALPPSRAHFRSPSLSISLAQSKRTGAPCHYHPCRTTIQLTSPTAQPCRPLPF